MVTILQGGELECPDQSRPVAAVHRPRPGRAVPRHRGRPRQHRAQRLRHRHRPDRSRLRGEAEDGRRNRYQRLRPRTSRRPWRMTGTSSRIRPEAGKVIFKPGFVIRVRDHRPVTASPSGPGRQLAVAEAQISECWAPSAWRARRRSSSPSPAFRRAGIPRLRLAASLEWAGEAVFW